ncbi:hypothetical protein L2E82_12266 [Cichorium intybus]|uniref:Uncharacterized protein n=1 Tax=Cichorium intybus TaxID=13427 RepID=A0ACB9GFF3_CICIN|nr:hypothetical protein L2E82_12266 [Cichorium intybus]
MVPVARMLSREKNGKSMLSIEWETMVTRILGKALEKLVEIMKARRAERSNGAMAVDKDEREKNGVVVGRREDVMDAVIAKTRKRETPDVSSLYDVSS